MQQGYQLEDYRLIVTKCSDISACVESMKAMIVGVLALCLGFMSTNDVIRVLDELKRATWDISLTII